MIGKTLGHYRVIEKIGEGGMGVVYRAHDESLDRDVALKVLPASSFQDPAARARLLREARIASQLNHPHICTIHEVGEAEGQVYVAMEFVEGQPLSARLAAGPLPNEQILRLGIQLAEALGQAHSRDVLHRDFKSANVIITKDGRAKVLDFGLAKRLTDGEPGDVTRSLATLTSPGMLAGTLAYMAPEQLAGQPADKRSDIWSLGVVLYEMAAGRRPFQGQTGFELSSAILNKDPRPLPAHVSAELRAVIERCLEKDPVRRFQRTSEVQTALEAIQKGTVSPLVAWRYWLARHLGLVLAATVVVLAAVLIGSNVGGLRERLGGGASRIQSLAVLPLANLSGDPEQEYFADGMTEELITNLGKISALKITSRTSVMQYKGTKKPLPQIAKELDVQTVIEGSVLREGGQVRITAQLIQASSDKQLWAESYQRDLRSVLALQAEIASAIADKVRAALTPAERTRLASARPVNPEAYEAYLKGMQSSYKLTPQALDIALEYFELALAKDPNYAPAYVGIAGVWGCRQQAGYTAPREAQPKAKAAALKAIELDTTLADGHASLAGLRFLYEWDWAGAEVEWKRAIELNPNFADSIYSHFLWIMKRPEEAMAQMQRALELDPLNEMVQLHHTFLLQAAGRYDEAIVQTRKLLRTSPENPGAHSGLADIFFHKAMYEESLAETKAYHAGDREFEEALTQGYAESGYRGAMRRAADLLAARSRKTYVLPADVAGTYVMAGEYAQALAWLEKGLEARDGNMPYVNACVVFESLRNTPRFKAILRRMNLPQ